MIYYFSCFKSFMLRMQKGMKKVRTKTDNKSFAKLIIHPWSKNIQKEIFNIVYTFAWRLPYWKNFYRKQAKQL